MFWCSFEQDEMVEVTYKIVDNVEGHYPDTEEEDTDTETRSEGQHTGGDTAWSRCYRLTAVCVMLLCVVLLIAMTLLWINYNIVKPDNELQTSNNNLTIVSEQLQGERAELQKFSKLGWTYYISSVYYISKGQKSWTESRQDCIQRGADLVIINSKEEQEFVTKLRGDGKRAWIGLSGRNRENKGKWVDDTPLITGFWASEEPNSTAGDEDCVMISDASDTVLNWAYNNCNKQNIWICEKRIFN